ncbi:MAG: SDR family NAD(P)-dependent oxidoreductase [Desulfobacterales bacterium]|nr:SDR family NAD(P)-dependent oxidoreductase [Desulfobacterales bacterium]
MSDQSLSINIPQDNHANVKKDISATKRALIALQEMQAKLDAQEKKQREPIAVIGMSCRFPGQVNTPEAFWDLLCAGVDAIVNVPPERWDAEAWFDENPDAPGKMYTQYAGFLNDIDKFDAQLFGISPREATYIDPHQRILLELVWEAFENANIAADKIYGSRTGVYVGISNFEYGANLFWSDDPKRICPYTGTGGSMGVTAGRISYTFGLTGPSFIIDTACSSSLVTTHLACQALRLGECDMAISAGVNLFFGPETHINFSKAHMLSPDGRCKTFDAAADGYGRGEGAGVVVLKKLSDAIRDSDKILAVILGSSVNQDGPSGGLTVPNGPSQRRVMTQALTATGIKPEQVGYVEVHGTGTSLGDPIEAVALGAVYRSGSTNITSPLWIGSVKTNFGHLESASGIAGLIKTILVVQHGKIPPHLHFKNPSPHIPWNDLALRVPTTVTEWNAEKRIAGLSSFSFSGTNAHILVSNLSDNKQEPVPHISTDSYQQWGLLSLSAKNDTALDGLIERYIHSAKHWERDGIALTDICKTAAVGRSQLPQRAAMILHDLKSLANESAGTKTTLIKGRAKSDPPKIAFLFTGQGSQYVGMGQILYHEFKIFRDAMEECDAILSPILKEFAITQHSLVDLLYGEQPASAEQIAQTALTQPVLFSLEYALAKLWQSWGIKPDILIGHSVGEYVAACIAGVFSLAEGLKLIANRGRLMVERCPAGAMLAVSMSEATIQPVLSNHSRELVIATVNAPQAVVVAGPSGAIDILAKDLEQRDVETKKLQVSHAFHSPMLTPMLSEFKSVAESIKYKPAQIPIVSNINGKIAGADLSTAAYWVNHVKACVRFAEGMRFLLLNGYKTFVEIGPKPTLCALGKAQAEAIAQETEPERESQPNKFNAAECLWLPSLRFNHHECQRMFESLGHLWVHGASVNWDKVFGNATPHVRLPNYPFQQRSYMIDWLKNKHKSEKVNLSERNLLGQLVSSPLLPENVKIFSSTFDPQAMSLLVHHRIFGVVVLPAAAHVELALEAGTRLMNVSSIKNMSIHQALVLQEEGQTEVQIVIDGYEFKIFSRRSDTWTLNSSGEFGEVNTKEPDTINIQSLLTRCPNQIPVEYYYKKTHSAGIEHGEKFQAMTGLWQGDGLVVARLELPQFLESAAEAFNLHPVLLDAAFQCGGVPMIEQNELYLPVAIDELCQYRRPSHRLWCVIYSKANTILDHSSQTYFVTSDLDLADESGNLIAQVKGLHFQLANRDVLKNLLNRQLSAKYFKYQDWLYQLKWIKKPLYQKNTDELSVLSNRHYLVVTSDEKIGQPFIDLMTSYGIHCTLTGIGWPALLNVVQIIETWQSKESPAVVVITKGAAPVTGYANSGIANSPLWEMSQVFASEYPEINFTMIDLDEQESVIDKSMQTAFNLLKQNVNEPVAVRADVCHVPRLERYIPSELRPLKIRHDATYLITGGLGDLGLLTAKYLVEKRDARSIILLGRSEPSAKVLEQIDVIKSFSSDTNVRVVKADVCNYEEMLAAVAEIQKAGTPLAGVIHAAGKIDDGMLISLTMERIEKVLAPKVTGAWNLHRACESIPLDFFILYSSVASQFASPAQASYASANFFLDALASYRQHQNLPAITINWGPWSDIGLAARLNSATEKTSNLLKDRGINSISPVQGLEILDYIFNNPVDQLTIVHVDWKQAISKLGERPVFENFTKEVKVLSKNTQKFQPVDSRAISASESTKLLAEIAQLPLLERHNKVVDIIKAKTADILKLESPQWVEEDSGFFNQGMDSLTAMELRNVLQALFGQTMPTTTLFKYPTVKTLATFILDKLALVDNLKPAVTSPISNEKQPQIPHLSSSSLALKPMDILVNEVVEMSDEELARMIDGELNDLITK